MDVANNFVGEKANRKQPFWQIVNERCPQKGLVFDEIDTNCGIVNRLSIYVSVYFEGREALTRPICSQHLFQPCYGPDTTSYESVFTTNA